MINKTIYNKIEYSFLEWNVQGAGGYKGYTIPELLVSTILEKNLQANQNTPVEVMNFGMGGFNLNDDYCYYELFVKKFDPDITLVFISNGDFQNLKTSINRPYCDLKNDSININLDFVKSPKYVNKLQTKQFRGKSCVLGLLLRTQDLIKNDQFSKIIFDKFTSITLEKKSSTILDLIPLEVKTIFSNFAKMENVIFIVISEPEFELEKLLKKNKVTQIDLYTLFDEMKIKGIAPNLWKATNKTGHWNNTTHMAIGNILVRSCY